MSELFGGLDLQLKVAAGVGETVAENTHYLPPPAVAGDGVSVNFQFTSPGGASVTMAFDPLIPCPDLSAYSSLLVVAIIQGGTGGTLDLYLQGEYLDGGWVDIAHYVQLTDGNTQIRRVFSVSRHVQQTTITTIGTDFPPALAANTVVGGSWGKRLRIVAVTGVGTSMGAWQFIGCYLAR